MSDRDAGKRTLVIFLGSLVGVPLIATLAIAAVVVASTMGAMVWNSWSANESRLRQEEERGARIEMAAREQTFLTLCPEYFQASFLDRWFRYRRLSWCEDYRDRFPGGHAR
ncbi:hypothetical protein QA648_10885 [Rhizobium sp. CB3171]|uniref:hypothetical protein n=1 Tax=Rhizobium sp. CB3171 TaxID=3039157 RepID=UPI0024B1AACD|nr:hypothetical protein [Rhizobium sp. CB3171]WFU00677.1 hypothetical protein QA648_10885 [Rhizobium sp. CB3171]